ncbi:InlB B-repeat-containing protein [Acholeplasma equirhinis]|uniref:InlB B-repeat-containing protein n=1 Tax=Acholeplasma equirhinis TaxID=555393 RepID=UPI00197A7AA7|nr:InlB B-repeat-containing protein [Acholeplasma equirhinis]MBN3490784.1 InlB B-repeat-containing protein [Acholeplasma equirhinis]
MKKFLYVVLFLFLGLLTACGEGNNDEPPVEEEPKEFVVTFDSKGGSNVASQTVEEGEKASKPADPTKDGFSFEYWYLIEGSEFDFNTPITANITLSAKWEEVIDEVEVFFNEQFSFLQENNYELSILIREKNKAAETIVTMYFDGEISKYVDGSYEAIYSKGKMYEKQGSSYVVSNVESAATDMFYYGFQYGWFSQLNDNFVLNTSAYSNLDGFIGLSDAIEKIDNLIVFTGEEFIEGINFEFVVGGKTYEVELSFNNFGEAELALPVVG